MEEIISENWGGIRTPQKGGNGNGYSLVTCKWQISTATGNLFSYAVWKSMSVCSGTMPKNNYTSVKKEIAAFNL